MRYAQFSLFEAGRPDIVDIPTCKRCGRALFSQESIQRGYGDECERIRRKEQKKYAEHKKETPAKNGEECPENTIFHACRMAHYRQGF